MKTINKIPTGKLSRSSKLVTAGAKIGTNYLKYYGKKTFDASHTKEELNESNASDIYDSLKDLKGSALKVAQMLSMEKSLLPSAYVEKFSLSQFSVPPLSAPLVRKTFKKYIGQNPEDLFEEFSKDSINAASIGQVHKAKKDGRELAVKIQYPGVADSISSDLAMVKPIAVRMFNLQGQDTDKYFKEIEGKLLEETDYILELEQSQRISKACHKIPHLRFPIYYQDLSSEKIITMDWMHGQHLSEFTKTNFTQEQANKIGQALWDFYMHQIHNLREVHADPHPGNFLIDADFNLIAIDFGCVKKIPKAFYVPYFELADPENINNKENFQQKLKALEILRNDDSEDEIEYFSALFHEMLSLFTSPFHDDHFDFGDQEFWDKIQNLSQKYSSDKELRKKNSNRGSEHFIYMNRTFFGLYNLLNDLKAKIETKNYKLYS
ncbi:MAG: AarF/ABC1/UbiB kinase family protein [Psychroflexus sp.]|nr:AarF/ABC1/UbiB kinase family protein [Psychroflexus sp.]MDN6310597.1 AarF/ABC1/UbiB kinase family protein [Psychroflexus sp.]